MNWSEIPFIQYLHAVDDILDAFYGTSSSPEEFENLAQAHQRNETPEAAALRLRAGPSQFGKMAARAQRTQNYDV